MKAFVYAIRNQVNGKIYVGKTVHSVNKRWKQHQSAAKNGATFYLYKAIRRYGLENFNVYTLGISFSEDMGSDLERFFIRYFSSDDSENGYNLTSGGEGVAANAATCRKKSEYNKEHGIKPPGTRGIERTPEWLLNMSLSRLGKPAWNKGIPHTEEHKKALRKPKAAYARHGAQVREDVSTSEIVKLYDNGTGLNCRAIAKLLGTNKSTVARRLKKAGVVLRPVGFQKGPRCGSDKCGAT